jgi:hypothetical protein
MAIILLESLRDRIMTVAEYVLGYSGDKECDRATNFAEYVFAYGGVESAIAYTKRYHRLAE